MNRDPKQVLTEWLVLSAQGGSETAFKELHDLWRADLRRFCIARAGRAEAGDEILNEVWVAIARGLSRLDDPACFPRWAFRIVERRSVDWIRARALARRREALAVEEADRIAPMSLIDSEPPESVFDLQAAISRLPAEARKLVHLYYEQDCSIGEIAEILGIPAGTVKSRLFSVRETLKQMPETIKHE